MSNNLINIFILETPKGVSKIITHYTVYTMNYLLL